MEKRREVDGNLLGNGKWMENLKLMDMVKLVGECLYCLAHFQMLLHMFALTSESPVFCSLSLSLILITAHPARRTE